MNTDLKKSEDNPRKQVPVMNWQWVRGTSLDLPPEFVNMSPVEPAYELLIDTYTRQLRAENQP